ncbi:MAG: phospho-sugar mutase [Rikenellaceae bacterium]
MKTETIARVESWLNGSFDEKTKEEIRTLQQNNPQELEESFYRTLEFGTGGLRGIMGVGTNRMNIYTVGMATQGLANYLKKSFEGEIKVAIAFDCRNNSPLFAQTTAEVFAANGFTVYLFESLRPTPVLSFTIRELGCQSGVVLTASHNPKEYNGYKAYWNDGAQVIAPHDTNIIEEVNKIASPDEVLRDVEKGGGKIITIGEEIDAKFLAMTKALSLSPEAVAKHSDFKIVYTPIHGTGVNLVPAALKMYGFNNIFTVKEQNVVDGNFPTVVSPNPEEPAALKMAVDLANEVGADIVMATDPDADRQALAIRDYNGELQLLNGNQTAVLFTYYLLRRWKDLGKLQGKEFIVKTIVSSNMIVDIAKSFGVEYYNVLTGFKFIADVIRKNEGIKQYIGGGEESFGFLIGDSVRDKDAVSALAIAAECAAWAKDNGKSLWDLMMELYVEYGLYQEGLVSVVRKGQSGAEEIKAIMSEFRANPPKDILGSKIVEVYDYQISKKWIGGEEQAIEIPKSNVLQWVTEDGTVVSVRPSGTEPKIKFYFSVKAELCCKEKYGEVVAGLNQRIEAIKDQLNLR